MSAGRPSTIHVEHEGREVALSWLARHYGIRYRKLLWRYHAGMRGERLVFAGNHPTGVEK